MFVGYVENNAAGVYRMLNLKTGGFLETNDFNWLNIVYREVYDRKTMDNLLILGYVEDEMMDLESATLDENLKKKEETEETTEKKQTLRISMR